MRVSIRRTPLWVSPDQPSEAGRDVIPSDQTDDCAESSNGPAQSDASLGMRDRLIELGGDDLAEKLDSLHGDEVTDPSISMCGPSHPENCFPVSAQCPPTDALPSQDLPKDA